MMRNYTNSLNSILQRSLFLIFTITSLTSCYSWQQTTSLSNLGTRTPLEIQILQINDVYEIAPLEHGATGGMARVAELRKELLKETPQTITILAGDFLNPSVIGTVKIGENRVQGAHMVEVMNAAHVDYVTFGNHEFDLKESDLQSRLNESQFEWISSNVLHQTTSGTEPFYKVQDGSKRFFPQYQIVTFKDSRTEQEVRMGLIAVTIPFNKPPYVTYEDPLAKAIQTFETVRVESDFVVAITHQNLSDDFELARRIPGLALIIGGHDHENSYNQVGSVPIAKADANAKTAYVHRIQFDPADKKVQVHSTVRHLNHTVAQDQEVAALVKSWQDKTYSAFAAQGFKIDAPVASLKEPLDGLESHIRSQQTNLGSLITKAMLENAADAELALLNSGSVRVDDYLQGEITQFDIIRTLPFGGKVLKVTMNGSLLLKLLNIGRSNIGTGGFLQMANVTATPNGDWLVNGAALDLTRNYRLAISDFLMSGRENNFEFLTRNTPGVINVWEPGDADLLRDIRLVLVEHFTKLGTAPSVPN